MLGVVFSPADTFRGVAAHPRWLGVFVVVLGISAALWFWFAGTEVGQQALLDQQIRRTESMGGTVTDEQYQGFERMMPMMKYIIVGSQLIAAPVITFILAGAHSTWKAVRHGGIRWRGTFYPLAELRAAMVK